MLAPFVDVMLGNERGLQRCGWASRLLVPTKIIPSLMPEFQAHMGEVVEAYPTFSVVATICVMRKMRSE